LWSQLKAIKGKYLKKKDRIRNRKRNILAKQKLDETRSQGDDSDEEGLLKEEVQFEYGRDAQDRWMEAEGERRNTFEEARDPYDIWSSCER
jgi:hypothetical protein